MDNNIKVSIICNVYNHEKYIYEALNSFIMQKTSFAFEVLVHEDASTDRSAEIIRDFEKRYPEIVKPVYQAENQYSQGISITQVYQIPRAKGKYIAVCEGDDYWTDPYKLQKQYDEMERHPELDMCAHAAYKLSGKEFVGTVSPRKEKTVIDTRDVILGGGGFFATNSLFYRKKMREKVPVFFRYMGYDYSLQIWGSLRGGVLFLPDTMSVYRIAVPNSWTDRIKKDKSKGIEHTKKKIVMLKMADEHTNGRYHQAIQHCIEDNTNNLINSLLLQNRYYDLRHGEYRDIYNALPMKKKLAILVKQVFHNLGIK